MISRNDTRVVFSSDLFRWQQATHIEHCDFVLTGSCRLTTDISSPDNPFTGEIYATCVDSEFVVFEDVNDKLSQHNVTWSYTPVVRYSRDVSLPPWDTMLLSVLPIGHSGVNITQYTSSAGLESSCPNIGVASEFRLTNLSAGENVISSFLHRIKIIQ